MGKKMRRKHLSEKLAKIKSSKIQKTNRFELNFSKEKYQVLGRRKQKSECGKPTVSRAKAFEGRLKTLGHEVKNFGKANSFVDRRLGEKEVGLSQDEKMIKRFALERRKRYGKDLYRLDETEEDNLTHYGQSLAEIEKYDDKPVSDEDEPVLGADINFGGNSDNETKESRKNFINDMISKSKQLKYEKQSQKEQIQNLTDQLDQQWKLALKENLVSQLISSDVQQQNQERTAYDAEYDKLVKELMLEKQKSKAGERLKSEEEIAKEERNKLEKLEAKRIRRMADDIDETKTSNNNYLDAYRNPDDEETNLEIRGKKNKKDQSIVRYNADGKIVDNDLQESAESSDDDSDNDDSEEEQDEEEIELSSENDEDTTKEQKHEEMVQVELPFVYEMPKNYAELKSLLITRLTAEQTVILDRLIKCLHPSLKEGNKQRLQKLFLFVLRYFDETSSISSSVPLLDVLTKTLYKLAAYNQEYSAKAVKALMKKHRNDFLKRKHHFPGLNTFAFLRLIPHLYPSSDFYHPIVTPALLLASDILVKSKVKTVGDIAKGLLLCSILMEYIFESKKFVPEIVAYLRSVFNAAVKVENAERPALASFGYGKPSKRLLSVPNGNCCDKEKANVMMPLLITNVFSTDGGQEKVSDESCLFCATKLARSLLSLWSNCQSFLEIFDPFDGFVKLLIPVADGSEKLRQELIKFQTDYASKRNCFSRPFLKYPPKPEKEMKFLEPRIETNFNPERKHRKGTNAQLAERQRLVHKYKREYKSTVREIRRDNEFLARQQFKERQSFDKERTEKTKRLMSSLMGQEADYKKIKRMKKD